MNRYLAMGLTVVAGAALVEVALIPGVVIGGAAVLAPRYLPKLRRSLAPLLNPGKPAKPQARTARAPQAQSAQAQSALKLPVAIPGRLGITQAVAKTITFRIIVTALDFTSNLVVLGEVATAAGLSGFAMVAGPLFYLAHETVWNYYGPSEADGEHPVMNVRLPQVIVDMTGRKEITLAARSPRRSRSERSPQSWISPRSTFSWAISPPRPASRPLASWLVHSSTGVTRRPGIIIRPPTNLLLLCYLSPVCVYRRRHKVRRAGRKHRFRKRIIGESLQDFPVVSSGGGKIALFEAARCYPGHVIH